MALIRFAKACLVAVAVLAPAATAQQPVDIDEFTARTLVRLTLFDLRLTSEQTPEDLELAWLMLGEAERLAPEDEHIVRMRLEAAFGMGDADAVLDQTRRVLQLDPDDEISQLRLITNQITRRQTVGERLAIYEGLVGERGRKAGLSAPLRSRLALDGALLMREQGDMDGFVRLLDAAVELDSTNKEAALTALAFFSESVDNALGRLDLLSNLLYADPVDPNVHDTISRELAAGGAFRGANRFLANEIDILVAAGRNPDETLLTNALVIQWQVNGPGQIVQALNHQLRGQRDQAQQYLRVLVQEQQPTDDVPRPDDVRLPVYQDLIRVLAADASGDAASLDAGMADMGATALYMLSQLNDPEVVGEDASPEQLEAIAEGIRSRLTTIRLWVGRDLDEVEQELAAFDEQRVSGDEPQSISTNRGWLALRQGDAPGALAILETLDQSPFVRLGIALAMIDLGREQEGLDALAALARENTLTPLGAWARNHYEKVAAQPLTISNDRDLMEQWALGIPTWLDNMAKQPDRFLTFEIEHVDRAISVLDRALVKVRIRNTSPIPLGIGPSRPISSRVMIVPRTDVGIESMAGGFEPEVFDVQRRLRIESLKSGKDGATFEVVLWPDPGETGFFSELMTSVTSRTRWRAVQGYTVTAEGVYQAGPMGLHDETNNVLTRIPLSESDHNIEELSRRIREDSEQSLPLLMATTRSKIQEFVGRGATEDQISQLVAPVLQAIIERYPECSPTTRLMMATVIQTSFFFTPLAPFEELVKADEDRAVQMATMFYRVTNPADPLLAKAAASGDPGLEQVAALVTKRLEDNRPMVSKMRPRGRR